MSARDDLVAVVAELRQIAADIAKANINGFGNAITAQADRLEALLALLDAEPVAWRIDGVMDSDTPIFTTNKERANLPRQRGVTVTALYARPQEASAITAEQRHILRHALGIGRGDHRNHFVTGPGSKDYDNCMELVRRGLMTRQDGTELTGGDDLFTVTDAGRKEASDE